MPFKYLPKKTILTIILIIFLINIFSYTVSAADKTTILTDALYVSEENYNVSMNNIVLPYLDTIVSEGTLIGAENIQLYYRKYIVENSTANIVIVHDTIEYIDKYDELIYYFTRCGYNVFIMEYRGTGRSDSLGIIDSTQVHIDDSDYYISDMKKFMDTVVKKHDESKKNFLFAHSIGAAISTKFIMENDSIFDATVLCSPVTNVSTAGIPKTALKLFADLAVFLGYGEKYAHHQNPYNILQNLNSSVTSSSARFYYFYDFELTNESIRRGGFSYKWLSEMTRMLNFITEKKNISKINTPVLILHPEEQSRFYSSDQKKFIKYAKDCTILNVAASKNDIYREKDSIQRPAIEAILQYYKNKL